MIRALIYLLALSGPAAAAENDWPALFNVTGVSASDVLNVRTSPSPDAPIIGALAADTQDVEVIGTNDRQNWGRVNIRESAGWVSLAYLERQPGKRHGATPEIRTCHGTEPFWSLTLDTADGMHFTTPDTDSLAGKIGSRWRSENRLDRHGFSARLGDADLVGVVSQTTCTDGMSDRVYGLSIDLILGGPQKTRHLSGCCSLLP